MSRKVSIGNNFCRYNLQAVWTVGLSTDLQYVPALLQAFLTSPLDPRQWRGLCHLKFLQDSQLRSTATNFERLVDDTDGGVTIKRAEGFVTRTKVRKRHFGEHATKTVTMSVPGNINTAPPPSSFDGDANFYEESRWKKLKRKMMEEPLLPLGCGLTCWALYEAQVDPHIAPSASC